MSDINLVGEKWGSYEVKAKLDFEGHKGRTLWVCECKCGRTRHVTTNDIKRRKAKQCLNCANRKYVGKISGSFYGHIKHSAIARKIEFNITQEEMWDLYVEQNGKCSLSGLPIDFADTSKEYKKDRLTTASLDRRDSSLGYIKSNVQWVHRDINMMKQRFGQEYFIQMCKNVAENNINA